MRLLEDEADDLDIPGAEVVPADAEAALDTEIVMVFGGDGTFLRAAELARYTDAALMGVNLGRVGFLAETEPEAVEETLQAIERCEYSVEERLAIEVDVLDADGDGRRRHLGAQRGLHREGRALPGARRRHRHRRPAADQLRLRRRAVRHPDRLHRLRLLRRRPGGLARRRGAAARAHQRARAVRPAAGHLAELGAHRLRARRRQPGPRLGRRAPHRSSVPDGGRVDVRKASRPVRIARVHAATFGDRLVAKFGLPVRGFRDARHAGPGHELYTSRNVLTRDVVDGNGDVVAGGEAAGAGTHDDA